ncbi:hypothetical protein EVAR_95038_1 [Eumeta japonica]|uniref:Histone-lysine N-methyltransferase SETMAR n=1 Tax=Eumeta variegata TaxID=151549 RepID=A0A4C1VV07_EUMVA|nr:hypothetical protein EVAR_95038_1 [Eumeta japonica]
MSNPAHSPDLAPSDFFLFAKIKNQLRGQRFSSPEEAAEVYENMFPRTKKNIVKRNSKETMRLIGPPLLRVQFKILGSKHLSILHVHPILPLFYLFPRLKCAARDRRHRLILLAFLGVNELVNLILPTKHPCCAFNSPNFTRKPLETRYTKAKDRFGVTIKLMVSQPCHLLN